MLFFDDLLSPLYFVHQINFKFYLLVNPVNYIRKFIRMNSTVLDYPKVVHESKADDRSNCREKYPRISARNRKETGSDIWDR